MNNRRLYKRATAAKDDTEQAINDLIDEIEELEQQVQDRDDTISKLEEQLLELKSILP